MLTCKPVDRPRLPVILLGDHALALIRDIFDQPDLVCRCAPHPEAHRRLGTRMPSHSRWSIPPSSCLKQILLDAIRPLNNAPGTQDVLRGPSSRRGLFPPQPSNIASERAWPPRCRSRSKDGSDPSACWIESLENGWLFLTPGWLLAVGAEAGNIARPEPRGRVANRHMWPPALGAFPAYARITSPLGASGWLACGTAAMAFDPICGDGTAHADPGSDPRVSCDPRLGRRRSPPIVPGRLAGRTTKRA